MGEEIEGEKSPGDKRKRSPRGVSDYTGIGGEFENGSEEEGEQS